VLGQLLRGICNHPLGDLADVEPTASTRGQDTDGAVMGLGA